MTYFSPLYTFLTPMFMLAFGIWLALRRVYPELAINGCAFHLGQAMERKLQELGLRTTYIQERSVHQFCRKVINNTGILTNLLICILNDIFVIGLVTIHCILSHVSLFQVMALPFLPAEYIALAFARLKEMSIKITMLYSWVGYVRSTWITNTTFPVESWSVFKKYVRTNNDVNGWHRRINAKASKANLSFYVLVSLLKS
ncbi:hypothetical protein CHS0354_006712 [Potamilus streckersoni]|uniref:Uncharacterized protein n=1 Tax=Potamilus streckersoni TaxID=2493646 RepID=A0AAE0RQT3_9BIVA|nr:hypothetical protein CHS0354_006712 [Potamilus streckersoni]